MFIGYMALCCALTLSAKVGCLSDRAGINRTMRVPVRPVHCHCPCDRYPHSPRRNKCARCEHYHADEALITSRALPAKQPWELVSFNDRDLPH